MQLAESLFNDEQNNEERVQSRSHHLRVDWTLSVTTIVAIGLALAGWMVQYAILGSRVTSIEQQQVAQAVANEKLASAVGRLDITLARVQAQVEERQRAAETRMDRNDLEMDRSALRRAK